MYMHRKWIVIFLVLWFAGCSCLGWILSAKEGSETSRKELEEKLKLVEQRVLDKTVFGRQMRDLMERQNTSYILDPSLPYQARYSMADDSIHYNPKFDPTLEKWKKELLGGRPIDTILKFHEELHRAQVSHSERGRFFRFFRENGQIKEKLLPNGRTRYKFSIHVKTGDEGKLLRFAESLVGHSVNMNEVGRVIKKKIDEVNAPQKERMLLEEIHAHIGSDIITAKGVYSHLYESGKKPYGNLPEMKFSDFSRLCEKIKKLYGFYNGEHDEVARAIGKSESISDFKERAKSFLEDVSSEKLNQKVNAWMQMKKEWARETQRTAKEVLK